MTNLLIFVSLFFEISIFYFSLPKLGLLKAVITTLVGNIIACIVASILLEKIVLGWQQIFDFHYGSEHFNYLVAIILLSQTVSEYVVLKLIFKQSSVQSIIAIVLSQASVIMFLGFQDPSLVVSSPEPSVPVI